MRRFLISAACAALIAIVTAGTAFGHGSILRASPGPGDGAQAGVDRLQMEFTTALLPSGPTQVDVLNTQDNTHMPVSDITISGATLTARIRPLEPGVYLARYTITANDGHPADGGYFFTVLPAPNTTSGSGAPPPGHSGSSHFWDDITPLVAGGIAIQVLLLLIGAEIVRRHLPKKTDSTARLDLANPSKAGQAEDRTEPDKQQTYV